MEARNFAGLQSVSRVSENVPHSLTCTNDSTMWLSERAVAGECGPHLRLRCQTLGADVRSVDRSGLLRACASLPRHAMSLYRPTQNTPSAPSWTKRRTPRMRARSDYSSSTLAVPRSPLCPIQRRPSTRPSHSDAGFWSPRRRPGSASAPPNFASRVTATACRPAEGSLPISRRDIACARDPEA